MSDKKMRFNPPSGWPKPPPGWVAPKGWKPDPMWPQPPPGWQLWLPDGDAAERPARAAAKSHMSAAASELPGDPHSSTGATLDSRTVQLEAENAALRARLDSIDRGREPVVELSDERILQDAGVYRYHHPLENALAYRERLTAISIQIADLIRAGKAIEVSNTFTFDGSLAKGRKMTNDLAKLMLRAYNAEAENVVRTLRAGSSSTAVKRLDAARSAIAKLGQMMEMHISDRFHELRITEIELVADYLVKKEEEREAARTERERLREERKVEAELTAAKERLEKERRHLVTVIAKLRSDGSTDSELEQKLAEVDTAIAQNDYRAANIRAGYVYVVSNRGAFGGHVVKIGLTRRLDPLERVSELGDASVPFRFDVHAIYFSEDAVKLEADLHEHFATFRMNCVNVRKEFFFASPAEVRVVLSEKVGNLLEFVEASESAEYLQSVRYWPLQFRPAGVTSSPGAQGE